MGFIVLFGCLSIFEFVMNRRMSMPKYQSIAFIVQIFPISILSSFYNLLCTLDLLKDDGFFAKSVAWQSFMFEHKCRIYFSIIINIINLFLFFVNEKDQNILMLVLILFYISFLSLNVIIVNRLDDHGDAVIAVDNDSDDMSEEVKDKNTTSRSEIQMSG